MRQVWICAMAVLCGLPAVGPSLAAHLSRPEPQRSELFKDSRGELALARARGERYIGVLLVAVPGKLHLLEKELRRLGGELRYRADDVGYLRAQVPIDQVNRLLASAEVQVADIQVRDFSARPIMQFDASGSRDGNTVGAEQWPPPISDHPLRRPYSALDDLGARDWLDGSPTFDGRGVTLAIVESALDLLLPELQTAWTLDGKPVRKIIEHRNVIDPTDQYGYVQPWVDMKTVVRAVDGAFRQLDKSYLAPRSGAFRFGELDERTGVGPYETKDFNLDGNPDGGVPTFGVLWDERTNSVWVDTDQDLDFRDERELKDYRVAQDVGIFGRDDPDTPRRETVGFSVQIHEREKFVAINAADVIGYSDHATAVAGVAVANASAAPGGRIDGTAPGAQLISIHTGMSAAGEIEGLIAAFRDPRADLVVLESNITHSHFYTPNDGRRVEDAVVARLMQRYPKPYFVPANNLPGLNQVTTSGTEHEIGIGMYVSASNLLAIYGLHASKADNLLHYGSFGPAGDGAVQPTLLAPTNVISLAPAFATPEGIRNFFTLAPGYRLCSGTSCAAPLAAGAAARLISGAKQRSLKYDAPLLRQALTAGARFLSGIDAHKQGHGLIQLGAAWQQLERLQGPADGGRSVRITGRAPVKSVVSQWLETPHEGVGLYEREGWSPRDRGQRTITLTRTSGPAEPMTFAIEWIGNETSVFSSAAAVTLPLNQPVAVVVNIAPEQAGAHSALFALTAPDAAGYAFRMLCTVVAAEKLGEAPERSVSKPLNWVMPDTASAYFHVPEGTAALALQVDGAMNRATLLSPDRTAPGGWTTSVTAEKLRVIEHPHPGVWELVLTADINAIERTGRPVEPTSASVTASLHDVDVSVEPLTANEPATGNSKSWAVRMNNRGASFVGGASAFPLGSVFKTRAAIAKLQQRQHVIEVPKDAARLEVAVDSASKQGHADLDVYLFNCTSGECSAARSATGSRSDERLSVDNPTAGRWVVVVDAALMQDEEVQYDYTDIVFAPALGAVSVTDSVASRATGASWTATAHAWVASAPPVGRQLYARIAVTTPRLLTDPRSPYPFHYLDTSGVSRSPAIVGSAEVVWAVE